MKNKKLIFIFMAILLITVISTVIYAAYSFTKTPGDDDVELGKINLEEKGFLYFDGTNSTSIEVDENGSNNLFSVDNNVITVYATEKLGYDDEIENTIYLNELGFQFSFTNKIDVYVRLHIQEAWISHKVYNNGTVVENNIRQDEKAKASNYISNDDWIYDETTGYFYLKTKAKATNEKTNFSFLMSDSADEAYFYEVVKNKNYRESVLVELSFTVDIVQANRAQAKWGVDIDSLLNQTE